MTAYYNEHDPYPAQWLRNLIDAGLIAPGDVDERSIVDVQADDLRGYTQCHFFAGIGGWSYALRLAGWPDDRPVWTGSCPCQPFSVAGEQAGFDDPRHLWPEFARLIRDASPSAVLGEQVSGASDWLRLVRSDLDAMGYGVGAMPIEAASADAEHFRDRYWFVAYRTGQGDSGRRLRRPGESCRSYPERASSELERPGDSPLLDHDIQLSSQRLQRGGQFGWAGGTSEDSPSPLPDHHGERSQVPVSQPSDAGPERPAAAEDRVRALVNRAEFGWGEGWTEPEFRGRGFTAAVASIDGRQYFECPDGKWRRLPPPRVRWLGTRLPARVARLRAFGNSIDPRAATAFIQACLECLP